SPSPVARTLSGICSPLGMSSLILSGSSGVDPASVEIDGGMRSEICDSTADGRKVRMKNASNWNAMSSMAVMLSSTSPWERIFGLYRRRIEISASGARLCGLTHDHEVEFPIALGLAGPHHAHQILHGSALIRAHHHGHRHILGGLLVLHPPLALEDFFFAL